MKKILAFGPLFIVISELLLNFDGFLRIQLYTLPPTVVVFYEHVLGAAVMLFLVFLWIKDIRKMTKKEWIAITLVSLFSGALGTIFYTAALANIHYSQYSVIVLLQQMLQPIWAIGAAAVFLKEKITKKFLLWAAIALGAAYLIAFKNLQVNLATGAGTVLAGLLALGAGFMWGTSTAISKLVLNKVSFLTGTALRFYIAPLFAFIFIVLQGQTHAMTTVTPMQWLMLIGITFTSGLVSLGFYYYGLQKTPARITTLCELTFPASAIFIDYVYFHQTLSITQILGVLILLLALYQVTKPLAASSKINQK